MTKNIYEKTDIPNITEYWIIGLTEHLSKTYFIKFSDFSIDVKRAAKP